MKTRLVIAFCLMGSFAMAQNYETKKFFIFSFGKLIQWPDDYKTGDFEIAVLGDSPITEQLIDMASKKKYGDRIIKISKVASVADINKRSHILILPNSQSNALADVIKKIGSNATLVITEQDGLGAKGSDINFVIKDNRMAFELNQAALNKHKLKAANELTRLAILL